VNRQLQEEKMERTFRHRKTSLSARIGASLVSVLLAALPAFSQTAGKEAEADPQGTKTPIKHLIVRGR
jgi:hypothetical protein